MKIWIICTGEPVPFLPDEADNRFLRAGRLAKFLAEAGHRVTWWTAGFDHYGKRQRPVPACAPVDSGTAGLDLIFLPSRGYTRHMSVRRFLDHRDVGAAFRRHAPSADVPDVILCSYPLIELADAAVAYGRLHGVPVVLDVRDLWPDIHYERITARTGLPVKGLFLPYEVQARRAFRRADAVVAITSGMLDWVHRRFGRVRGLSQDRVFRQVKDRPEMSADSAPALDAYWAGKGVDLANGKLRFVWSGSIVPDTDGPTLLQAVRMLEPDTAARIEIVICGVGALVPAVEAVAARHPCLKYAGWVSERELNHLLARSHVGLLCYLDRPDFQMSTPNKVIDYCAAGLRILTNLTGEIAALSDAPNFLIHYPTGHAKALAERITALAADRDHFVTKSDAAYAVFDAEFDAARVQPAFAYYLEAMARR
ncbi:glycosyltransferase [Oceaniradius stylonematis]|uniref:glycosyltransferase n=1 Tax=Oceaniradius stylonematis TaxID=2184161 RepID=UPI00273DDDC1|nr:glycosyltransferase [Oceaniradius stylonematis]